MKFFFTSVLSLIAAAALAQRGHGTRGAVALPPPVYPTVTFVWVPNTNSFATVLVCTTNLALPVKQWPIYAVVFNDITNVITVTATNSCEFFRAYSE